MSSFFPFFFFAEVWEICRFAFWLGKKISFPRGFMDKFAFAAALTATIARVFLAGTREEFAP